ncbi:DsbA family protein [Flaviaesturariibacter aridisoli]|uniref:DsbA family protein n=1 Tax=Flaviaesturariibacter aridisoli TaxID=2545761 RepID=UPI001FB71847|nr:DsbA family protein [Flaviaesturariibacter aridisoli]
MENKEDASNLSAPFGGQGAVYYCYDAWCGWCYGFSPVIKRLAEEYKDKLRFEVLSGGMIRPETPQHFGPIAKYIQTAYTRVEELTGVRFGEDFLWHVFHPDDTDWFPDSTMPAIALCILKEAAPERQVEIASDLQYALNFEGRDLTDPEAYRHLLPKYGISEDDFYTRLSSEEYRDQALYEFSLVQQLQVTGFPAVLLQVDDLRFYLLASGYTHYDDLEARLERALNNV